MARTFIPDLGATVISYQESLKWFRCIKQPLDSTGRSERCDEPGGGFDRFRNPQVQLFTPWGPRYDWEARGMVIKPDHKEVELLQFFADLLAELQENMPWHTFEWTFLAADLYGARINHLPPEVVEDYFDSVQEVLAEYLPEASLRRWSEFDEQAEPYRQAIRDNFDDEFRSALVHRARKTAKAMGLGSNSDDYLVERLAEARLIEDWLHPVKISPVARHKNQGVDGTLPVFYFVPPELHAPWMG